MTVDAYRFDPTYGGHAAGCQSERASRPMEVKLHPSGPVLNLFSYARSLCLRAESLRGAIHIRHFPAQLRAIVKSGAIVGTLLALSLNPLFAQSPRAILVDGSGPWRDAQWAFTVSQFSGLLNDAGYSVTTVSPVDLPSALSSPGILLAVPSLASLPFATFTAVTTYLAAAGSLMASGGQPFSDALYLTPNGQWLDYNAYLQAVGSPPPQGAFTLQNIQTIPTISPSTEQYTNSAGLRVPVEHSRGVYSTFNSFNSLGHYRVIGDLLAPSATLFIYGRSHIVWLPWPQISEPMRTQLVTALTAAPSQVSLLNAGADQTLWLPGETITGSARLANDGIWCGSWCRRISRRGGSL